MSRVPTELVRFGDVMSLQRREVKIDLLKEYTLIGVYSFGKGILHREPALGADLGDYRFHAIEPGDLVLSNIQAWEGAIALAGDADAGTVGTHRFLTYLPSDDRVDVRWMCYFLLSEAGATLVRSAAPGTAVRNRTLSIGRLEDLSIPLPTIEAQNAVADRIDWAATSLHHLSKLSDSRSQRAAAAAESLLANQSGWSTLAPMSLCAGLALSLDKVEVVAGATYNIAGVYSFGRGLFPRGPIDGSETTYKHMHRLRSGDLVLSRLKGWEGALAVIPEPFDGWFLSPEFPTFAIDDTIFDRRFLKHLVASEILWSRLKVGSTGIGARKERVSAQRLLDLEVSVPTVTEQRRLADQLDLVEQIDRRGQSADEIVRALTPSILNQAFAGML